MVRLLVQVGVAPTQQHTASGVNDARNTLYSGGHRLRVFDRADHTLDVQSFQRRQRAVVSNQYANRNAAIQQLPNAVVAQLSGRAGDKHFLQDAATLGFAHMVRNTARRRDKWSSRNRLTVKDEYT